MQENSNKLMKPMGCTIRDWMEYPMDKVMYNV
jgi:hypothetical protein